MYFAFGVLNTLFHRSLDVVKSAVLVYSSPGYVMRLPPAVIRIRFGSSFCGQKSTTTFAYVTTLSEGMCFILSCVMTNMEFVPF